MKIGVLSAMAAGLLLAGGGLVATLGGTRAVAQSGTGTVTGQVLWCPSMPIYPYPYPLPLTPDGVPAEGVSPGAAPEVVPEPGTAVAPDGVVRPSPIPRRPIKAFPAGAVLVAAQGTSVSTRTDENGRFSLTGVPAGPYFTIAAGPVTGTSGASAQRVNVQVSAQESVELGVLFLAPESGCAVGRSLPGIAESTEPGAPMPMPMEVSPAPAMEPPAP